VSHATRSGSGQNTQVFTAVGKTRKHQIVTQPIEHKQSAILFVRSHPIQEFESEGEGEAGEEITNNFRLLTPTLNILYTLIWKSCPLQLKMKMRRVDKTLIST